MRTLYHVAKADLLERIRNKTFLQTVAFTLIAGYLAVPTDDATHTVLDLGGHRGIYNSAWVGGMISAVSTILLALIGFYLVRQTLMRDRITGVGQILGATPMAKSSYIFGKALSNFAYLSLISATLTLSGVGMQIFRGEDTTIRILNFVYPWLFIVLPTMALVAAVAVLFETVSWLRGSLGNIIYFFLWAFGIVVASAISIKLSRADIPGISAMIRHMSAECAKTYLGYAGEGISILVFNGVKQANMKRFIYPGFDWSLEVIMPRFYVAGMSVFLIAVATLLFDRFRYQFRPVGKSPINIQDSSEVQAKCYRSLPPVSVNPRFTNLFIAELRLLVSDTPWWGLLSASLLAASSCFLPINLVVTGILPILSILPLTVWSPMGGREQLCSTAQIVYAAPKILTRQLIAQYAAGVSLSLALYSGAGFRFLMLGDHDRALAIFVGSLFIPALALCLGIYSGGTTLFEIAYICLWYAGALNQASWFDYLGVTNSPNTFAFAGAAATLFVLAFIRRRSQVYPT